MAQISRACKLANLRRRWAPRRPEWSCRQLCWGRELGRIAQLVVVALPQPQWFPLQVWNAQQTGAKGVIVVNYEDRMTTMEAPDEDDEVRERGRLWRTMAPTPRNRPVHAPWPVSPAFACT